MFPLIIYSNIVWETLASAKKMQEKETKGIKIKKEEITLSPFTDGMAVFVENSKASNKKTHIASKWIQQNCRIQGKYTRINCFYTLTTNRHQN